MMSLLQDKQGLSQEMASELLQGMLVGALTNIDIQQVLYLLAEKGESEAEIGGFVDVLLQNALPFERPEGDILELCGTGGSGQARFNVSTTVVFLCASLGIPVAKHGNVGSREANGSFDFLQALGLPSQLDPSISANLLLSQNCCFLFAKQYHPVLKKMAPIRQALGRRSIFNLCGPLSNPARPSAQVLGCTDEKTAQLLLNVLINMGRRRVAVLVGAEGVDEVSTRGITQVWGFDEERGSFFYEISPEKLGLDISAYPCSLALDNARFFHDVFGKGDASHSLSKHVALSAAVPLLLMKKVASIEDGVELALQQIASKALYQQYLDYQAEIKHLI